MCKYLLLNTLGINLIGGNHCVVLDREYLSSAELQGIARIDRPGQCRPICIYYLIAQDTFDEVLTTVREIIST